MQVRDCLQLVGYRPACRLEFCYKNNSAKSANYVQIIYPSIIRYYVGGIFDCAGYRLYEYSKFAYSV